ncbi:hypothetical protein F3B23_21095 [Bacteroides fragilis]|uniref:Uncharacterized protein n=2 Tax=Bacteroides fragilis TaxID=817 RepID=Q64P08_BACFR|nr:hypothetical protein F3B28_21570 [Bacteroides fragilis]BAD50774.1 hypothetical protein BF4032 [Bacteroides fragilis YCH46]KAA4705322.1 hypothetical protein F3B27_20940 [Bacteroides fragilis]KAA4712840.1 hypothetical protein F3B32_21750 [Bacteroides fragilis]KAA4723862.1 hypothetical protein F3B30_22075 [Bacteroides fragilis]
MGKGFIVFFKTVKIHFSKNNSFKDTSLSRNLCNPVTYEVTGRPNGSETNILSESTIK